jgi:hypothetical protein
MEELNMVECGKEGANGKRRRVKMDTVWETCIHASEEPRKVTWNRVGFPKCINFRRKD